MPDGSALRSFAVAAAAMAAALLTAASAPAEEAASGAAAPTPKHPPPAAAQPLAVDAAASTPQPPATADHPAVLAAQPAAATPPAAPNPVASPAEPSPPDRALTSATPRRAVPRPAPVAAPAEANAAAQPLPPAELASFVDGFVAEAMGRQHIAGVAVAVVQNGQVVLKRGYGFAKLGPPRAVDPDRTLFRLGEVSQVFTWIAVMREAEAGRLRLEQPVNLYLPERVQVRDEGYAQPVRMLDLMAHAEGFEDRAFGQRFEKDPDYVRPLDLYLRKQRPHRVRPPGETATVSAYGAALAGEAVSWVAGKPFEQLTEEEILLPLGLGHTTFREPRPAKSGLPSPMAASLAADAADGFRWQDGAYARQPYEFAGQIAPAEGGSASAGDMARLMLAMLAEGQLDGVTLYGPQTAKAFRTPILVVPDGVNGWARGLEIETLPGGRRGFGAHGETLAFASRMVVVPELNLGVFVTTNSIAGQRLTEALPAAVIRRFYGPPQPFPPPPSPALAETVDAFSGHFLSTRRAYTGLQGFVGRLLGASEVRVTREGRLATRLFGHAPRSWTPVGDPQGGRFVSSDGVEQLVFRMQSGGAQSYLASDGAGLYERVSFWRSVKALAWSAALAAAAALGTLAGLALRNRKELRETQIQSRAGLVQNLQAGLWLTAMGLFAAWSLRSLDPPHLAFGWPSGLLVTASACGLVAGALTVTTLVAMPAVWQGGRRVDSWSVQRKLGFTITVLIYAVFAWLLARAGALSPWAG
jgi:CubicO group peptidase (beta-lactamase class C family)